MLIYVRKIRKMNVFRQCKEKVAIYLKLIFIRILFKLWKEIVNLQLKIKLG